DPDELEVLAGRLSRYLGATLIEHTQGAWAVGSIGTPAVKVPGVPAGMFEPRRAILDFRRLRWFGQLRDRTEDWDLPLRRRELAQLVAARDSELALLRADVEQLTGRRIGELDASSLAEIEYALRALLATTDTGGIRRVHRRVTLLVGSLYADALG